jgi:hypothetical protein
MAMLEFGPTYELTADVITSKLNAAATALEDDSDPPLLRGTRFIVFDWNEWHPFSGPLKSIGVNPNFYAIRVEGSPAGTRQYLVLAHRLERDSRLA